MRFPGMLRSMAVIFAFIGLIGITMCNRNVNEGNELSSVSLNKDCAKMSV